MASTQPNMPAISYSLWWSAATLELRTRNLDSHNPLTLADRVAPEDVHLDKRPSPGIARDFAFSGPGRSGTAGWVGLLFRARSAI